DERLDAGVDLGAGAVGRKPRTGADGKGKDGRRPVAFVRPTDQEAFAAEATDDLRGAGVERDDARHRRAPRAYPIIERIRRPCGSRTGLRFAGPGTGSPI